ncbi:MAG: SUMF1/EgtB/PvdO family nonheme iron enzyme [Hyphomicrobiales bacterium]
MRRSIACFVAMSLFLLTAGGAVAEERRVALMIGMSKYENVPALPNPAGDARALGEALAKLNFEVVSLFDADKRTLETTLRDFGKKAAKADVIVVFYAGHGVQVGGQNYMIPVDASLDRLDDLPYDAVPLGLFLGAIRNAGSAGVMIVDACRNNPFLERLSKDTSSAMEIGIGLGRVDDTPSGTLLAMAARANTVAYDGAAAHSPYTQAILEELATPGVELHLFFGRVADRVKQITGNKQEPYISGTLGGASVYLNPKPANHPPEVQSHAAIQIADTAVSVPLGLARPTDRDATDELRLEIVTLPVGGDISIGGRVLAVGDVVPAAEIEGAVFTADGTVIGNGGNLAYRVTDGNGGSVETAVAFKIVTSNKPPSVSKSGTFNAVRNSLGISLPIDPDGDPLTITVQSVPQAGKIRDGRLAVAKGDRLEPAALPRLSFDPEDAPPGPVGRFTYKVEDGQGGAAVSAIDIDVSNAGSPGFVAAAVAETAGVASAAPPPAVKPPEDGGTKAAGTASTPPLAGQSVAEADKTGFSDCEGCPIMVSVPGGTFVMGSSDGNRNERPVRKVTVKRFAAGKYEISMREWRACVKAGACAEVPEMDASDGSAPVRNISWEDSMGYVEWLSARTGKKYRLLSEAEWEFAARAGTTARYWWGDKASEIFVSCADCGGKQLGLAPPVVRGIKPNPLGLVDTNGGVAEWVMDCWKPTYEGAPVDGSARPGDCSLRVLRGGSWLDDHTRITVSSRGYFERGGRKATFGLRVAREAGE